MDYVISKRSLATFLVVGFVLIQAGMAQNTTEDQAAKCQGEGQITTCSGSAINATADLLSSRDNTTDPLPSPTPQAAAPERRRGEVVENTTDPVPRPDLDTGSKFFNEKLNYQYGKCIKQLAAEIPVFSRDANGSTLVRIEAQPVPELNSAVIESVKDRAVALAPKSARQRYRDMRRTANSRRGLFAGFSGFQHPGGYAGPAELAQLQERVAAGVQPQVAAKTSLLTDPGDEKYGTRVADAATPEGNGGPYPMEVFHSDYYGYIRNENYCPPNYPEGLPKDVCGHYAFVELDGSMSYRQAMAYVATGDERHAQRAMDIVQAWATTNKVFGPPDRNGPLEAAWGCAPLTRTMDALRATWPGYRQEHLDAFMSWMNGVLMPQMDHYIDIQTPAALAAGRRTLYGNWHASVADCMMAVGVLADDRRRYEKGLEVYRTTVADYFKWGRGFEEGRILGEASETLRDVYHTLFGLGSLVQAAETAWGQNTDVYSESGHVLAAAMELHARIINSYVAQDESMLPPKFKFFPSMPAPPENCTWKWDFETQLWSSYEVGGNRSKCSELNDGFKYAVGIKYLPNGYEIGYNHFVGRLGMKLPETAALLSKFPVDWFTFSWGLGTLTHADTAKDTWRPGVKRSALCNPRRRPSIAITPPSLDISQNGIKVSTPGISITTPLQIGDAGGVTIPHADLVVSTAQESQDPAVLRFNLPSLQLPFLRPS